MPTGRAQLSDGDYWLPASSSGNSFCGSGISSGGTSDDWSYNGGGSFSLSTSFYGNNPYNTDETNHFYSIAGTLQESGSDDYSSQYSTAASLADSGAWTETGGASVTETGGSRYAYSGSGGCSGSGTLTSYSASASLGGSGDSSYQHGESWTLGSSGWSVSGGTDSVDNQDHAWGTVSGSDTYYESPTSSAADTISISQQYDHEYSRNTTGTPWGDSQTYHTPWDGSGGFHRLGRRVGLGRFLDRQHHGQRQHRV